MPNETEHRKRVDRDAVKFAFPYLTMGTGGLIGVLHILVVQLTGKPADVGVLTFCSGVMAVGKALEAQDRRNRRLERRRERELADGGETDEDDE